MAFYTIGNVDVEEACLVRRNSVQLFMRYLKTIKIKMCMTLQRQLSFLCTFYGKAF